jgi:predicted metal-dependent hydrolase
MAEIILHRLAFETFTLEYSLIFSKRKTLGITVKPDGEVIVKAPENADLEIVEQKIRKRISWILRQQNFFRSFGEATPKRRFISGESHLYMGRQYILRVIDGKKNEVRYKGRYLEVECTDRKKVKTLMHNWYLTRAKIKFPAIAEPIISYFENRNISPKGIYIKRMENRWGSCTRSGKIILNSELIKAPRPCIEYVITHEMCHLLYPNHTKEFFALLSSIMPDWEKWKNRLERVMR